MHIHQSGSGKKERGLCFRAALGVRSKRKPPLADVYKNELGRKGGYSPSCFGRGYWLKREEGMVCHIGGGDETS